MDAFRFYQITLQQLSEQAQAHGVRDLSRYYELTDYHDGSFLNNLEGKAQVFAQIAFHAQNATMISNIVKFEINFAFLETAMCHLIRIYSYRRSAPAHVMKRFHKSLKPFDTMSRQELDSNGIPEKAKKKTRTVSLSDTRIH